jgi:hypothetical protein
MNLSLRSLLLAMLVIAVSGCGDQCRNEPVTIVPSPSGASRAVVFHRNCGATTEINTQVAVLPRSAQQPNIPGNALILGGDVPLRVRWESETALTVSGLGNARVFKQSVTAADIAITYEK